MIKTLFASASTFAYAGCIAICCMGNDYPAKAGCHSYGDTATCTDYNGGRYTVDSYGSVRGTTGNGEYVNGRINGNRFTGSVGNDYVTCDRVSCY